MKGMRGGWGWRFESEELERTHGAGMGGMGDYIVKMKGGGQGDVRGPAAPSCARAVVVLGGCALMFGKNEGMAEDAGGSRGRAGA